MTTIDHQQAAVRAMNRHRWATEEGKHYATMPLAQFEPLDSDRALLAAAAPHLRAEWEQPIRELHRPVHAVFSWASGAHYEEPCETCYGAPGVHECGCWADTQLEYVCAECHRLGSGSKGVYDYTWPCPTIALLEGGGE